MFKVFRRIRKQLLSENRVGKFLLYAVGEIILVVIGILIAINLNNSNQADNLKTTQQTYLVKLHDDVSSVRNYFKRRYDSVPIYIGYMEQALKYVESCGTSGPHEAYLTNMLIAHQTMMKYYQKRSTYDEMVATGIFAGLENDDLKESVAELYGRYDFGNSQIDYFRDELGRASFVIMQSVDFSYNKNGDMTVTYDLAELCDNRPLRNALVEVIDANKDWYEGCLMIRSKLDEVIELLEPEIMIDGSIN